MEFPSDSESVPEVVCVSPDGAELSWDDLSEEMASSSTSVIGDSPPYISCDVSPRLLTSVPYDGPAAAGGEDGPGSADPPSLSSLLDSLLSSAVSDSSSSSLSSVIVFSDL